MSHKQPRNEAQATALLERFGVLEGEIAGVEAKRNRLITMANAAADKLAGPALAERDEILSKLEPWWDKAGGALTKGKRKSIELGGCVIGSRTGKDSLVIDGDEDAIVKALQRRKWAGQLVRTKVSIDKAAVLLSMDGSNKSDLVKLGFGRKAGVETFFVKRTEQAGTMAGVSA